MKATGNHLSTTLTDKALAQSVASDSPYESLPTEAVIDSPPYVVYLSDTAFSPSSVSQNVKTLFGIPAKQFIGNPGIWKKIIPECDQNTVFERFKDLEFSAEISCLHRIFTGVGMPTWVSHKVTAVINNGGRTLCGIITPIAGNDLSRLLEPQTIATFTHKLGNHFQLLNLAFNSLGKGMVDSQDLNILQEAFEKATFLTRAFSEYSQEPAWVPGCELLEVVDAAIRSQSSGSIDSQIEIQRECDPGIDGLSISADPYLLEMAVTAILENALEATNKRGKINIRVAAHSPGGIPAGLKLLVSDHGVGIAVEYLSKVMLPFFSTKANHLGLGLSMAFRFIAMHGGFLDIKSTIGKGTEVLILLPINRNVQDACR